MTKADGFEMLKSHVEIDEAYVGGRRSGKVGRGAAGKTIVMGFKERCGRMETKIIPDNKTATLRKTVLETVEPGSKVSTDELLSHNLLAGAGFDHETVRHRRKEYARGEHHVNSVEGFWKIFKDSINSTHIHISQQHMDRCLGQFSFRSNHRQMLNAMFDLVIAAF